MLSPLLKGSLPLELKAPESQALPDSAPNPCTQYAQAGAGKGQ